MKAHRQSLLRALGIGVGVLGAFAFAAVFVAQWRIAGENELDVRNIYEGAVRVAGGTPLYRPWFDYGPHYITGDHAYPSDRVPYPPFLMSVLSPAAAVPYATFERAWRILMILCLGAYAAMLAVLATGRFRPGDVLIAVGMIAITPYGLDAVRYGNPEPLLWATAGGALLSPRFRGAGFMVIALIKLHGVWPLLFATWREGRTVLISAAAALLLAIIAGIAAMGAAGLAQACSDWFRYALPVAGQGSFSHMNWSLSIAGLRAAQALGWEFDGGPLPSSARAFLFAAGVAAPILAGWMLRGRDPLLLYAGVLAASILFAPLFWRMYLPLFLLPAALMLSTRTGAGFPHLRPGAPAAAAVST